MKQGMGKSTMGGQKVEPKSTGINPGAAASIGVQEVRTRSQQIYTGRGIEAPKATSTCHKSGSQGRH